MSKQPSQRLKDMVIVQIMKDIQDKDLTVIDELLNFVPDKYLKGFLREENKPVTHTLETFTDFETAAQG